ncbi:MAG TPA: DUF2480 family protein [Bacteroidia bacterium]|jgi:hypothetical protein|nr:DUF2480 family protein [Bacteroidia bacterium]
MDEIINKVEKSGLKEINLEDFYIQGERYLLDIKQYLTSLSFGEGKEEAFILKEKDFREYVKTHDWTKYKDKLVAITCTADAVIPTWAYMLIATVLQSYAKKFVFGDLKTLETVLFQESLSKMNPEEFRDKKIIIRGCSNLPVPESAYVELTRILVPFAKSIMYGEACSTVPLMKKM